MGTYIAKRLMVLFPTLLLVAIVSFMLMHLTPGDPAAAMLGVRARDDQLELVRKQLGLDKPIGVQLVDWLTGAMRGDLGESFFLGRSVTEAIFERMPLTMALALIGLVIALVIGIPLGVISAVHRGKMIDQAAITASVAGVSVPSFWLAAMLIWLFAVRLRWLPSGQYVSMAEGLLPWMRHMALPGLTMGITSAALVARITRSAMLEVLHKDYIRTARAKGVIESRVIFKHALRNALVSVLTVVGMLFGSLIGGAVVMENVFSLPGMGRLVVHAVEKRDYPVLQGTVLFMGVIYMLVNFITDVIYVYVDPRIRYD